MADTIEARCAAKGLRMTGQRRMIAQVLEGSDDHPDCRGASWRPYGVPLKK